MRLARRPRQARREDRDRLGDRCRSAPTRARCSARLAAGEREGDPRQRALERARREGHRRQADAGRRRRRLRLRDRRATPPTASCKAIELPGRACSRRSPTAPRVVDGREAARRRRSAFIDGLLHGACADALRRRGLRRRRRDDAPVRRFRRCWRRARGRARVPDAAARRDLRRTRSPATLLDSLGEPGALDALWLSLRDDRDRARAHPRRRHAGRLPARHALASAAARSSSRWSSCRSCCRPRSPASRCSRRSARRASSAARSTTPGIELVAHDGRRRGRADVRRGAVLPAPGAGGVRGRRPDAARGLAHARRVARRARSRASRSRPRCPGSPPGAALALGPRARRVRRDADVRRLASRASRRPRRSRSTTASRPTSTPRSRCRPCWSPSRRAILLSVKLVGGAEVLGGARALRRARARRARARRRARGAAGRVPGARRAVGRGQDQRAARRRRPAARPSAGASRAAARRGSTPRAASTCRPSGAAAATCSRTTRCSRT